MEDNGADGGTRGKEWKDLNREEKYRRLEEEMERARDIFELDVVRKKAINLGFFGLAQRASSLRFTGGCAGFLEYPTSVSPEF